MSRAVCSSLLRAWHSISSPQATSFVVFLPAGPSLCLRFLSSRALLDALNISPLTRFHNCLVSHTHFNMTDPLLPLRRSLTSSLLRYNIPTPRILTPWSYPPCVFASWQLPPSPHCHPDRVTPWTPLLRTALWYFVGRWCIARLVCTLILYFVSVGVCSNPDLSFIYLSLSDYVSNSGLDFDFSTCGRKKMGEENSPFLGLSSCHGDD